MTDTDSLKPAYDLIYLVSCAVNGEKPDKRICDKMDLAQVLNAAIKQSLCVAAASALEKTMSLPADFREEKYKVIRRLSLMNIEREKLIAEFEKNKIRYVPLKGIVIKECYPKSSMRDMGDNDILCDEERARDIKEIAEGLGFVCKSFGKTHHDVYVKSPRICFEIHRSLFDRANDPDYYDYFADIRNSIVKDGGNGFGYHLSCEDQYLFQLCHMFKHYKRKGTGLRSLLDIYVFLRKYGSSMDKSRLDAELEKTGLAEFESAIRELSFKVFTGQPLTREESVELSYFIVSNTHGTNENYMTRQLNNDDSAKAKRRYALSRIFPPRASLKNEHSFVYSHMWIYPFWIIYRPFKGAVKYRRRMLGEISSLKNFKKKENNGRFNK